MEGWVSDFIVGGVTVLIALGSTWLATTRALNAWKTAREVEDATQNGDIRTLKDGLNENKKEIQNLKNNFQQHQLDLPNMIEERMEKWSKGFFSEIKNLLIDNNNRIKNEFDVKLSKKSDKRTRK